MARVVVIDDSPFVYKAVKRALEAHGYEIIGHAENGKQGLEMISTLCPDVVTLDVTMPIMDGLEVAAALSKDVASRVIMLSAMGDDNLMLAAKNHGIEHFLCKPFNAEDLRKAVELCLKERG